MATSFLSLCLQAYNTVPGITVMKGNRSYKNWAERLLMLGKQDELDSFRRVYKEIVEDEFATLNPLKRFIEEEASSISLQSYITSSNLGATEIKMNPYVGFILTWVALTGWIQSLGDDLFAQYNGMPNYGWTVLPYTYGSAALKLGGLYGTRNIVDQSYNVLMAAQFNYYIDIQVALRNYRALAAKVQQRFELAIENLADALHQSALPSPVDFRAEIEALLWTLGFIPECQSMRVSNYVPSRSFLKKIIWMSLERLPFDPLTQYVWLEMKDKPAFNLRNHRSVFDRINIRYNKYQPDEFLAIAPSQIYAQTLISWLKGTLNSDQAGQYLTIIEQVREYEETRKYTGEGDWSIYLRMISLAYVLAREFNLFEGEINQEQELETWHSLWEQAIRMRNRYHLNPHRPDLIGTLNYPLFHLVDQAFAITDSEETEVLKRCEKIIKVLEQYRAAALSYSLTVTPPLVREKEQNALDQLLEEEHRLLNWLRGAFFLLQYEFLPDHFRRYATDSSEFLGSNDPKKLLNLETGRKEYQELEGRLKTLYIEMQSLAPEYAGKRMDASAEAGDIISALSSHTIDQQTRLNVI